MGSDRKSRLSLAVDASDGDSVRVVAAGALTIGTLDALASLLELSGLTSPVVIDMSKIEVLDLFAIELLARRRSQYCDEGCELRVEALSVAASRMIELTRIGEMLA